MQRSLRVLVVDDEKDQLLSLLMLLRAEGHEVAGVGSAKAMWDRIGEFEPDVVLLDIGLPDRSGYEVARDLRRTYGEKSGSPVLIAVTAWNKSSDRILAVIAGFDHHVGKPYEPQSLLDLLRQVTGKPGPGSSSG